MCRKIKCETCDLWTWTGCGQHIDAALDGIPDEQVCRHKSTGSRNLPPLEHK